MSSQEAPDAGASPFGAMEEVTVALAAGLAQDGRRKEAEEILQALPGPASPARADLLARLRAQQGDLEGAERFWREVPADDGIAKSARAGLRRIDILRRRPKLLRFNLWFGVGVLAVCVLLAAAITGGVMAISTGSDADVAVEPSRTPIPSPTPSSTQSVSPSPIESAAPPTVDLKVPGATVSEHADALVVTFDRGLFHAGQSTMTRVGEASLAAVAARIKASDAPLAVTVVGHTDNVQPSKWSPYADNTALGYARAASAAAFLQRASGLPLAFVTAESAGASRPVANNGTRVGRARNRTVVLQVRMR